MVHLRVSVPTSLEFDPPPPAHPFPLPKTPKNSKGERGRTVQPQQLPHTLRALPRQIHQTPGGRAGRRTNPRRFRFRRRWRAPRQEGRRGQGGRSGGNRRASSRGDDSREQQEKKQDSGMSPGSAATRGRSINSIYSVSIK